jgi:hypothetical protein
MARAHRLPTTFERVGFENTFCSVHWATSPRNLKLSLQAIDVWRIDRAVPKHYVGSQREHVLNSLDHGTTKSIRSVAAGAPSSTLTIFDKIISTYSWTSRSTWPVVCALGQNVSDRTAHEVGPDDQCTLLDRNAHLGCGDAGLSGDLKIAIIRCAQITEFFNPLYCAGL